ncbi:MAG: replication-associated recombination protein A [Christensenellales bacterium]|jgi:putative ATPase
MDLFSHIEQNRGPLADRMRPETLDEFIGQQHLIGKGKLLRRAIEADALQSSIFFGPPGCGKTTLAHIIAKTTHSHFIKINAVSAGVKEVRELLAQAEYERKIHGTSTYLLLDECHRWSKAQSDSILPALEKGIVRFIGSTTENPMVSMTGAIVSRCRLFQFYPLGAQDIIEVLAAALSNKQRGLGSWNLSAEENALEHLAAVANGDARSALNALELAALTTPPGEDGVIRITLAVAEESIQRKVLQCDETQFYDMLSAFCKSLRGSDSDAALAWFARLITAGVDPRILARRIIAHASEDVGLANPQAMVQAVAAAQALEFNGMPEARLNLAQAIIFLCESPKSNAVVTAVDLAFQDAQNSIDQPVPLHLRDTSYQGAKSLGNGQGYLYPHDFPGHYVRQAYMPPDVSGKQYYLPTSQGSEGKIKAAKETREKKPDKPSS